MNTHDVKLQKGPKGAKSSGRTRPAGRLHVTRKLTVAGTYKNRLHAAPALKMTIVVRK